MKRLVMILMMVFGLSVAAFAEVKLLPEDAFNNYIVPASEDTGIQPQIAYVADTWEDVYEKTGVDRYGWKERNSMYCDNETYQYFLIVKVRVNGVLVWTCLEYPGDGSSVLYTADAEY